ncbi:putative NADPH2 dehydrogenase chain OYE2 [Ceratobasidium sp. AG-I]|nr:putative NADPH2 dehydrogenase chain OYE2 [Ceratobasidium sp. AG-I]
MSSVSSPLFSPLLVGDLTLAHRVIMAPMTRLRASNDGVVGDATVEYYSQRSAVPGTLIISEGTSIAAETGGFPNLPGIHSDAQIAAWKKVTDAIHANGSYAYLQIAALGRVGYPEVVHAAGFPYVSSSAIQIKGRSEAPVELSESEVKRHVELYAQAARNAVDQSGFDGVEIHACNGSLIDQFMQDVANKRTDKYGGSIENRARFVLEVTEAVTKAVGDKRVGIRFSPWSKGQEMGMRNPIPTYSYIISELVKQHPELAYIHMIQPGIESSGEGVPQALDEGVEPSNDFAYNLWTPRTYITGGGYTPTSASETVSKSENTGVALGRLFISNPDLPVRIRSGYTLAASDPSTHYTPGDKGYTDYPSADITVQA